MAKLRVTQLRGSSGKQERHRRTLRALGLGRVRKTVEQEDRPEIRGMIARVRHLVDVEEIE